MGKIESTWLGQTNTEVNIFEGLKINNTLRLINTCTVGSKHWMPNSRVTVPSKDLGPPAVLNSTSLLISEIIRHLFPWKCGIMCFEFAISRIFSAAGSPVLDHLYYHSHFWNIFNCNSEFQSFLLKAKRYIFFLMHVDITTLSTTFVRHLSLTQEDGK